MRTREELKLDGFDTQFPLDSVKWGGSVASGIPSDIVDSKLKQISGTAELTLRENISRAVDEDTYPGLKTGVHGSLISYNDDKVIASTAIMITKLSFSYDKISLEFSSDFLSFSNRVRVAPQAREMPEGWNASPEQTDPWARGLGKVFTQCSPLLGVFHAFRAAGYHAVPDIVQDTIVDLPMQWSAVTNEWDYRSGHTYSSTAKGDANASPALAVWNGMTSMTNCEVWATSSPDKSWTIRATQGHFLAVPNMSQTPVGVTVIYGGGNTFSMTVYPDGNLIVSGTTVTDTEFGVGFLKSESAVLFSCNQTKGTWWVEAGGVRRSGAFKPLGSRNGYGQDYFTGVKVFAGVKGYIHGIQVRDSFANEHYLGSTKDSPLGNFNRTLKIDSPLVMWGGSNPFTPGIKDESAREVLDEICKAMCATWWIDEDNIAQYRDVKAMLSGNAARSLSFDEHVGDYTIEEVDTSSRDSIDVSYSSVAYSRYRRARVILWQGKGDRMDNGEQVAYDLKPEDNTEWLAPDFTFRTFDAKNQGIFMDQEGSWIVDYNPDKPAERNTKRFVQTVDNIAPWAANLTIKATGTIALKLTDGPVPYTNMDTPVLRGRGRMIRTETLLHVGSNNAMTPYHHDAQRWVTEESVAQNIANFLKGSLPEQKPSLTEFTAPYMPYMRLGEIVELKSGYASSRTRQLVILSLNHEPESHTTKVECLELSSYHTNFTWREAEQEARDRGWAGKYDAIESERQFNNTPWRDVESNQKAYSKGV